MRLTKKKVKELIQSMTNERLKLYPEFKKVHEHHIDFIEVKDILIIGKYNWLGGQLIAYQKILQIMQLKVK